MTVIKFSTAYQARLPHVSAPARCPHCDHRWQAVAPADARGEGPAELECPACGLMGDAARHHRVCSALEVIDDLREKVRKGEVVAFAAVGIEPDDTTMMWSSCTANVSRLRCMGAIAHLLHAYQHGEDMEA